ncbi:MAG: orotate phosphoribosyltransferase [Candidatus Binatia bacterium]
MNEKICNALLETKSVYLNIQDPFVFPSGRISPVYVDCRRLISYPNIRDEIVAELVKIATDEIGLDEIHVVAGGTTGGIPYATFLAQAIKRPLIYVQKSPNGWDSTRQITGVLEKGQKVVLMEDVTADGMSVLRFRGGIEIARGRLTHCLCVFEYRCDQFGLREAYEILSKQGIILHSLVTWDDILDMARRQKYFTSEEYDQVLSFLRDPNHWWQKVGL